MSEPPLPNQALRALDDVRSVAFLFTPDYAQVALLRRAAWKSFAPLRWTGIGGRLEGEEVGEPAIGALRELREETGLTLGDISDWRFVADIADPGAEVRLVYFTARYAGEQLPPCTEGTLQWVALTEYPRYDIIENTRAALDAIVARDLLHTTEALPLHGIVQRDAAGKLLELVLWPPR